MTINLKSKSIVIINVFAYSNSAIVIFIIEHQDEIDLDDFDYFICFKYFSALECVLFSHLSPAKEA